jgi:hypothetical protein
MNAEVLILFHDVLWVSLLITFSNSGTHGAGDTGVGERVFLLRGGQGCQGLSVA